MNAEDTCITTLVLSVKVRQNVNKRLKARHMLDLLQVDLLASGARVFRLESGRPSDEVARGRAILNPNKDFFESLGKCVSTQMQSEKPRLLIAQDNNAQNTQQN